MGRRAPQSWHRNPTNAFLPQDHMGQDRNKKDLASICSTVEQQSSFGSAIGTLVPVQSYSSAAGMLQAYTAPYSAVTLLGAEFCWRWPVLPASQVPPTSAWISTLHRGTHNKSREGHITYANLGSCKWLSTKPLLISLQSGSSQKVKCHMFLVFAVESKLFPKAAALEGDIAEYLAHALVWALRVVNSFLGKTKKKIH